MLVRTIKTKLAIIASASLACPTAATADQLYQGDDWAAFASDQRANEPGDILTVIIAESSRSSSSQRNQSSRSTDLGGGLSAGSVNENVSLDFGGS